jgi:ATPase subunit of ABC transporter with duplicated ATPase domains
MPASVTLKQLSYSTPDGHTLFSDLGLTFGPVRTGLIGRNGTGKTTLLRLIAGEVQPASGSVLCSGTFAMLRQHLDTVCQVADLLGVGDALARLDRLERGEGQEEDFLSADWTLPSRVDAALAQMGLPALEPNWPLATLSGGQRTRVALAALILKQPDFIFLDEPTNSLDASGRDAVAHLLHQWRGGAIVVSHDRTLLRRMDAIVELTTLGATTYGGNWDYYQDAKAKELAAAQRDLATAERQEHDAARRAQEAREKQARRDGRGKREGAKGGTPRILLGMMKNRAEQSGGAVENLADKQRSQAAEQLTAARAKVEVLTPLSVKLSSTGVPAGRIVLSATGITGGPDPEHPIIRNLSLTLTGAERVAIAGPNGSGKTSLLRLLTGDLPCLQGAIRLGGSVAFLDQSVSLLDPEQTIRENFARLNPDSNENTVRAALARFMFRAEAAMQHVGSLSGGERMRAGLAVTIGGDNPPALLCLDEPTNHLDISAVEAVEAGLRGYDGALLVVSHDADFLAAIGTDRQVTLD